MTSYAAHAPHIHKKTNTGYISHTPTHTGTLNTLRKLTHTDTLCSSHTLTHIGTLHTSHTLTHTGTLHTPHTPPTHSDTLYTLQTPTHTNTLYIPTYRHIQIHYQTNMHKTHKILPYKHSRIRHYTNEIRLQLPGYQDTRITLSMSQYHQHREDQGYDQQNNIRMQEDIRYGHNYI